MQLGRRGGFGGGRGGGRGGFGGGGRVGGRAGGGGRIGGSSLGTRGGQGLGGIGRAPAPRAPRPVAPRRGPGFGTGVGVGMGMGMGMRRRRGWGWGMGPGWGWGWGRRRHTTVIVNNGGPGMHGGPGGHGGGGCGCFSIIFALFMLILVVSAISMFANFSPSGAVARTIRVDVARSTVVRTALPRGSANDSGPWFTDNMNPPWIGNTQALENGMRNFFAATGVRPHLYLVREINGSSVLPTVAQLSAFAESRYDELFNDEAHALLVFFENANHDYAMYLLPGAQARTIFDDEAIGIVFDYIGRYYYSNLSNEEMFSRAFNGAGTRIMDVTRSPWINVMIVFGVLLILFLLFTWWKSKKEQANLEAEQTERILSQQLDSFGTETGDVASQLAQEYEDNNNNKN